MSKAQETKNKIIEKWKAGTIQIEIASELGVSNTYVSQVLAPLKKPHIIPSVVPKEIKRLFDRINRNVEKTWGFDNKQGREKHKPKYRNLYEDWESFKEWFENL